MNCTWSFDKSVTPRYTSDMALVRAASSEGLMASFVLSASCVAIANAIRSNTLVVREQFSQRFGDFHFVIEDGHGMIEIALTREEADERVGSIKRRIAA